MLLAYPLGRVVAAGADLLNGVSPRGVAEEIASFHQGGRPA